MHRLYFLLFISFYSLSVQAQLDRFRHLKTSDGLPENTGQCIVQDSSGFIWIATQNGLARYDGFEFKVYQNKPDNDSSLSNNQVEYLLLDEEGFFWVATRNGLNRFDPVREKFERFLPDSTKAFHRNWFRYGIEKDSRGHLWCSTVFGFYQILNWERREFNFYPTPSKLGTAITYNHEEGRIYASSGDSVFYFEDDKKYFHSQCPEEIQDIYHSSRGLLGGTLKGVYVFQQGKWVKPTWLQEKNNFYTSNFYEDNQRNLWILSNQGLILIEPDGQSTFRTHERDNPESLSHALCISMLQDKEGLYWIGTGQGVNILDPRQDQFTRLGIKSGNNLPLPDPHIEAIDFSDAQNLWIGTSEGLLHVKFSHPILLGASSPEDWPVERTHVYSKTSSPRLANDNIDCIVSEDSARVLVGTHSGDLFRINHLQQTVERWPSPELIGQLRGICISDDGYWVGYRNSFMHALNTLDSIGIPTWLDKIKVLKFGWYNDQLWVGSPPALYVIDPKEESWRHYPAGEGAGKLPNTMLTHLYGSDSLLWITTFGGGLYEYHPDKDEFKTYTEVDGLPNNNIWAVYPDQSGHLWLSTDNGISRFNPADKSFENFSKKDGVNFDDFSLSAHAQSPLGEILFGNPEGLTVFHPSDIKSKDYIPPAAVTKLEINYKSRPALLKNLLLGSAPIKLYPDDKTLSISLAILGYASTADNLYSFKLDGYDEEWVERPAQNRHITYTDLPTGKYTLMVRSSNGDGVWSEVNLKIPLEVIPPIHETWWFKSIVALMIFILLGLLVYLINRRRYLRKIRSLEIQQKLHGERERISRDLHDNVGAHLTKIITDLDILSLQLEMKPAEVNQEQIEVTRGFTQNTVRLLRDTIWAIDQDEFSVEELADKVENYLDQYLGDYINWKVSRHIQGTRQLSPVEVMNLLRIIQEATQNMLKYAKASFFEIVIKYKDYLEIEISDDGIGFKDKGEQKERYGLKNMKNRAEEISAKFQVHSTPGKGTIILVTK